MTPDELAIAGRALFGSYGWQTRLSEAMRVDGSTVRRWVSGAVPIPGYAEALIECLLSSKSLREKLDGI